MIHCVLSDPDVSNVCVCVGVLGGCVFGVCVCVWRVPWWLLSRHWPAAGRE